MKELGGFRMGPFELMDFIGNDVNYAVTRSVFEGFFYDPRYKPSLTQRRLVEAGFLGKKSRPRLLRLSRRRGRTPEPNKDPSVALLDLRADSRHADQRGHRRRAHARRVARRHRSRHDEGGKLPQGVVGVGRTSSVCDRVLGWLEALQADYGEDRYRPSPLLRRMVRDERRFFE